MKLATLTIASTTLESARSVSILPEGHPCRNLHGHSFQVTAFAELPVDWSPFPGGDVAAFRGELEATTAPLNYKHLNQVLDQPTDENLARWVKEHLRLPNVERIAIQSTAHQGVDLDRHGMAHVWRRYRLEAAHQLPNVPPGHKCGRMHGHGFEIIVHANQDLGSRQLSIDYDHIDRMWAPLQAELNYHCLNDIEGLSNPTSELISSWLWSRLKQSLPELSWITVFETGSCGANFDGNTYRIWKDFTLDSAVQLKRAPDSHHLSLLHGHTFLLRLHLHAPLDQIMGWTIDFGDVKAIFDPIFKQLDHRTLNDLASLSDTDTFSLAQWIYRTAKPLLPQLARVDLYETLGCGAIVAESLDSPTLPV